MGSFRVTWLLLLASAVVLVCQARQAGFPFGELGGEGLKRALDDEDDEIEQGSSPVEKTPFKRLLLFDDCSDLMEGCHPLQHCCRDLKCKYNSYLPPKGRCKVDLD